MEPDEIRRKARFRHIDFMLRESRKLRKTLTELERYHPGRDAITHLEGSLCGLWLGMRQGRLWDDWAEAHSLGGNTRFRLRHLITTCTELWMVVTDKNEERMLELRTQMYGEIGVLKQLLVGLETWLKEERKLI